MSEDPSTDGYRIHRIAVERDLADISVLEKNEQFNRFYLRRLRERRDQIHERFETDPPEKCDKDEREILRRLWIEMSWAASLLETEKAHIRSELERLA